MSSVIHTTLKTLLLITLLVGCSGKRKPEAFVKAEPEQKGFSKEKLDTLTHFLENSGSSSLLILVDGEIIYQWGDVHKKHLVHSIRKALLNSLYGIYIGNGTIDTTMTLGQLGIDDIPPSLTAVEKTATIADLLKSRSGVYHNAAAVSEGMLAQMPARGSHMPNEVYYYNNWDFNVLGYILENKTGQSIYDLFNEHIAKPLQMDYANNRTSITLTKNETFFIPRKDGFYQHEPEKSKYPAYHFRLSTMDLAKYGQLYLNNGVWEGKQIIPKEWIEVSTKAYSVTYEPAGMGYGMLWKVLMKTEFRDSKSFYHTGVGIHMLGIYPAFNLVLIHRVNTEKEYDFNKKDFRKMISLVWGAKED